MSVFETLAGLIPKSTLSPVPAVSVKLTLGPDAQECTLNAATCEGNAQKAAAKSASAFARVPQK